MDKQYAIQRHNQHLNDCREAVEAAENALNGGRYGAVMEYATQIARHAAQAATWSNVADLLDKR